jgi:hypothetical protein
VFTCGSEGGVGRGVVEGTLERMSSLMLGSLALIISRHSMRLRSKLINWSCEWPPPQQATLGMEAGGEVSGGEEQEGTNRMLARVSVKNFLRHGGGHLEESREPHLFLGFNRESRCRPPGSR